MSRAHGAAASLGPMTSMVAVAIYSADPAFRLRLEQLLRAELGYTVAGVTNDPAAGSQLIEQRRVDTVVAQMPSRKLLTEWRNRHAATTFVVIAGETDEGQTLDALYAGASAILPRSAASTEIATAIDMASRGLALLPRHVLEQSARRYLTHIRGITARRRRQRGFAHAARARGTCRHG